MPEYSDHAAKIVASHNGIRSLLEYQTSLLLDAAKKTRDTFEALNGQVDGKVAGGTIGQALSSRPTVAQVLERNTELLLEINDFLNNIELSIGQPSSVGLAINQSLDNAKVAY